jgi:hypothetical protein
MLSPLSSSIGINDTPFIDAWHGKPSVASPRQQSSAGNGASGLIAELPSRPYIARSVSACSCYVAAHQHTPCWFGVIADHLQPRPRTKPPTQKSSIIPSGIVVCHYHDGGEHGVKLIAVDARVGGFGPTLWRTEGSRYACLFVFWAAQSAVAASKLCIGTRRSLFSPYLPPHSCHSYSMRVTLLC